MTGANAVNFFKFSTGNDWQSFIDSGGDQISFRFRFDKRNSELEVNQLISFSELAKYNGKELVVEFCCDANDPQGSVDAIIYLKTAGVNVPVVEFFNEFYSLTNPKMNFEAYMVLVQPILTALESQYDNLIYAFNAPPRPFQRSEHATWHEALKAYLVGKPANIFLKG